MTIIMIMKVSLVLQFLKEVEGNGRRLGVSVDFHSFCIMVFSFSPFPHIFVSK